jgi:transposase
VRAVLRARIVLLAADGAANAGITAVSGVSVNTVRKWRGRFAEHGMAGLGNARRPGRPRIYGPHARVQIVATATRRRRTRSRPGSPAETTRRSGSRPARYVACTWPRHPVRYGSASTRRPRCRPAPASTPLSRPRRVGPRGREFEYIRHGTVSIVAAMDIDTGQVLIEPIERNDSASFVAFLDTLDAAIDQEQEIHLVLDNGSSHTAKHTKAWFRAHPRWHVHWTPPHASWLNMIEIWFSTLAKRVLRYGDLPDRGDLTGKIETFTILHNETARPYRWTYDGTPLTAA